jgi:hypothetical protein
MRALRLAALVLAIQAMALAQLDPDTLTINVTRNLLLQPDQVSINVFVSAPADSSFDDVLAALQGSGLTAANLTAAYTFMGSSDPTTDWSFSLAVPVAKLKDAIAALQKAQDSSALDITFFTAGPRTSPELLASQPCPYATLVSYARTQAQKVADAAGVGVGPIIGVSDSPGGVGAAVTIAVLAAFDPTTGIPSLGGSSGFSAWFSPVSSPCTMAVQFKLLH